MSKSQADTNIRVICRLRPLNKIEIGQGGQVCVEYDNKNIKVKVEGETNHQPFSFDRIFGPESRQIDVFNLTAKPVIDNLMQGYNGTIFAYGQTSCGKTFTMEGPSIDNEELKGIIPRMMDRVFELILNAGEHIEFTVRVSMLEIYNEKIQDLLDQDRTKGIYVAEATEIYVNSPQEMQKVMQTGASNRTIAATRMNENSSRSHSIFCLTVHQKDTKNDTQKQGKIYFVDLAGSEKISKTNVTGQQLEEAKNINKSLSALGNVINALTETKKNVHIPYRDSKLTRMLQESLGGNSQTTLIIACSMCSYNDKETLSTLRFGYRAKSIKNKPMVNVERSAKELMQLLEIAEKKIKTQDDFIIQLQNQVKELLGGHIPTDLKIQLCETEEDFKRRESLKEEQIQEKDYESENEQKENHKTNEIQQNSENASKSKQQQDDSQMSLEEKKDDDQEIRREQIEAEETERALKSLEGRIEIDKLRADYQNLQNQQKEIESELHQKTIELLEANEKLMQNEENSSLLIQKQISHIQQLQLCYEKLCFENQENSTGMNQLRRDLSALRYDLKLLLKYTQNRAVFSLQDRLIDQSLDVVGDGTTVELIVDSVKKTLSKVEILEQYFKNTRQFTSQEDFHIINDELLKAPQPYQSLFNQSETTKISEELNINKNIDNSPFVKNKKNNNTSQIKKNNNSLNVSANNKGQQEKASSQNKSQIESQNEEETFGFMLNTEESVDDRRDDIMAEMSEISDISKDNTIDEIKNFDEIIKNILKKESIEEKLNELQNLVIQQRKTIDTLTRNNIELIQQNEKQNLHIEKLGTKYKQKIQEFNSKIQSKSKEKEEKSDLLEKTLNEKIFEISRIKEKFEDERDAFYDQIRVLKEELMCMTEIAHGNPNTKRLAEAEQKIRQLNLEKQKFLKEIYQLREEIGEKEDIISDKNYQIRLLQNNVDGMSRQIETIKASGSMDPNKNQSSYLQKIFAAKRRESKNNDNFVLFDKNVVKPIRGGGGNIKNFERNNFVILAGQNGAAEVYPNAGQNNLNDLKKTGIFQNLFQDHDDTLVKDNKEQLEQEMIQETEKKFMDIGIRNSQVSGVKSIFSGFKNFFS